jgi:hypothetical protein
MSINSLALKRKEGTECRKERSRFRAERQAKTVIELQAFCYLVNRTKQPTERSHAFANRLRIFYITDRTLDFLRMRGDKGALEKIPAQGDHARGQGT